jgi:hypothetical protein
MFNNTNNLLRSFTAFLKRVYCGLKSTWQKVKGNLARVGGGLAVMKMIPALLLSSMIFFNKQERFTHMEATP